jgi:hypothetical protein
MSSKLYAWFLLILLPVLQPPTAVVLALGDPPPAPNCPRIPQVDTSVVPTWSIIPTYPQLVQTSLNGRLLLVCFVPAV